MVNEGFLRALVFLMVLNIFLAMILRNHHNAEELHKGESTTQRGAHVRHIHVLHKLDD